ncbi:MAG: hypothetical protein H6609_19005 [Ignavibacteriales bacterium]|nr:hypothetical protein [Ignavibacteriales bacterium]
MDSLFFLKEISPILSPLYWIGIFTPILIIWSISKFDDILARKPFSYYLWASLVFLNCINFLIQYSELGMLGDIIKYTAPVFLFMYSWKYFSTIEDIEGLLFTFIIASLFPIALILFENFVTPVSGAKLSESRGGGIRFEGFYADSFSYAIYFVSLFLAIGYFYLKMHFQLDFNHFNKKRVLFISLTIIIGLISIKHTATWGVLISLFILFLLLQLNNVKNFIVISLIVLFSLPLVGQYLVEDEIAPLLAKEINILEGNAPLERSFNGRAMRWVNFFSVWIDYPIEAQLLGVSLSNEEFSRIMVSGNTHSDFVRFFFLTGIIGFIGYIALLLLITKKSLNSSPPLIFIQLGSVLIVTLFSVSAMPLLYANLTYLIIPLFTYTLKTSKVAFET